MCLLIEIDLRNRLRARHFGENVLSDPMSVSRRILLPGLGQGSWRWHGGKLGALLCPICFCISPRLSFLFPIFLGQQTLRAMSFILQKDIPRVKQLCESLGFRSGSDRPHFQLTDLTQQWRRQYRTKHGTLGSELKEWRNPKVQDDFESMTKDFLDNRGPQLWPAGSGFLEYPYDKPL